MTAHAHLTDCGLPGIKAIPYGVHMCHFYQRGEDLAATLVPYFTAGLRSNERCIWITAEPLPAEDAAAALRHAGVDAPAFERNGSLVIRDHAEWYGKGGMSRWDLVGLWLQEEERALADGYAGIRISGNISFVNEATWPAFMDYEALLDRKQSDRRIVSLCCYGLGQRSATDILDVVRRHAVTLDRPDAGWQILTSR